MRGPDGREWAVRREWLKRAPRWPSRRKKQRDPDPVDGVHEAAGCVGEFLIDIPALAIVGLFVLAIVLAFLFVWPAVVFLVDLLVLLLLAAWGVALRTIFKRPWRVFATTDGPPSQTFESHVVGWSASLRERNRLADDITTGRL